MHRAAWDAERLSGTDLDRLAVDGPCHDAVEAVDRFLVVIVTVRRRLQSLPASDHELERCDAPGGILRGHQEADCQRPEPDGFVCRIHREHGRLVRHDGDGCLRIADGQRQAARKPAPASALSLILWGVSNDLSRLGEGRLEAKRGGQAPCSCKGFSRRRVVAGPLMPALNSTWAFQRCQPHCAGALVSSGVARTICPAATSICAIVGAEWSPSTRGVLPARSCCARNAHTTTNSYALNSGGRVTMTNRTSLDVSVKTVGHGRVDRPPPGGSRRSGALKQMDKLTPGSPQIEPW